MSVETLDTKALKYELEIEIEAPKEAVWKSLTEETNAWWLPDFHMVGEGSVVTFDARAGGELVERRADGGSLLWGTVHMCTPGESLHMVGHHFPQWGGPATSLLHFALEERGSSTVFRVIDGLFGHVAESHAQSLFEGWTQLFSEGLKPHAEASGRF